MVKKNKGKNWRKYFILILSLLFVFLLSGCVNKKEGKKETGLTRKITKEEEENITEDIKQVIAILKEYTTQTEILDALAQEDYLAVDRWNTQNLRNEQKAEEFCENLKLGVEDKIVLYQICEEQLLIRLELQALEQKLGITRTVAQWEETGDFQITAIERFQADSWKYTQKGYLFYKRNVPSGFDGPNGIEAIRIKPLEEELRQMCQLYIAPIGYENQNLFLINWTEKDVSQINVMDLYEYLYKNDRKQIIYQENYPDGIPEQEFEQTVTNYFAISDEAIKQWADYDEERKVYHWRERGMMDYTLSSYPIPEVVAYQKNADNTLTLTIDAVWAERDTDKAFTHLVTIRILNDGKFQYVGNQILESKENEYPVYIAGYLNERGKGEGNRITYYKNILESKEKKELKENVKILLENMIENEIENLVIRMEEAGEIAISEDRNMVNYQKVVSFYEQVKQGKDIQIILYEIEQNGMITVQIFTNRNNKMQRWSISAVLKDRKWELQERGIFDIDKMRLTQKGYLIYHIEGAEVIGNTSAYYGIRVLPLSEECRTMKEMYFKDFSYLENDMLLLNWKEENLKELHFTEIFEYLYQLDTQMVFQPEKDGIPAELLENIILKYFPITVEELRSKPEYKPETNTYDWKMCTTTEFFPPVPEVIHVEKRKDGCLILQIDAVWIDRDTDCAFQNTVVIKPKKEGGFFFIENMVEAKEMKVPDYIPR